MHMRLRRKKTIFERQLRLPLFFGEQKIDWRQSLWGIRCIYDGDETGR